ncbi:MAG: TonB-dependent receptor [Thermodesulfobacteriota bacterium]|nr:TonB-dependent receptor [Thermodesulfobacteriota bacterium]
MKRFMNSVFVLVICGFVAMTSLVYAQEDGEIMEEVVVTATRISTSIQEVGSSVTVISKDEIEAKGLHTVQEVLKGTVGLDVTNTGGPGQTSRIFLRGANSYHTLVLIDGVEMNDPTGINRGFNFANLTAENIDRIEVIRGPQSVLYGADAMGGVINIITKRGKGEMEFYLGGEGGPHNTWKEFGGFNTTSEKWGVTMEVSHISSDGFSAADEDLPGNREDDGWENGSASASLDLSINKDIDLTLITRVWDGRTDLDNGGGPYQDQEDYSVDEQKIFTRIESRMSFIDDKWEQTFSHGFGDHKRDYNNDPWSGDYTFDGAKHEVSWQHNLYLYEENTLSFGIEYEQEKLDNHSNLDESVYTYSFFIQDQIKLRNSSFTTVGLRYDDHEQFGGETTFRITQSYLVKQWDTQFRYSYGTGFRAPSLSELYYVNPWGGPGGNPDLDPESSIGWDIGVEQSLLKSQLIVGAAYFQNDFEDLIEWNNGYENLDKAKTKGVESFVEVSPQNDLSIRLNYTYTDSEDDEGDSLLRRPLHKAGLNTLYYFTQNGTLNLGILYVGERDDSYWDSMAFSSMDVVTDDYIVVNLAGSYNISDSFQILARIENLFDEDYYEAYGYGTAGFSTYIGMKVTL